MRRALLLHVVAAALLLAAPADAMAQRYRVLEPDLERGVAVAPENAPSAAGVFLASAVLPGAGQYRLGAGRWVAYLGVEAWAWINWADARGESSDLEGAYRDLAWYVARRISVGRRSDREFEYYEAMSHYSESGSFDSNPALTGVQPEEDTTTFNGDVWQLAREIFLPARPDSVPPTESERAAALDYYQRNAIGPQFAWSWGSNQLEHEQFRSLIRRSDDAARAGTTMLGVLLVNHVVSAVDALITARLRPGEDAGHLRIRSEYRRGPMGPNPFLVIEIPTP